MPHSTSCQKKAIKAYEAKVHKHSTDNSEAENSDDIGNLSVCDEAIENNNAASIMKRFQAAETQSTLKEEKDSNNLEKVNKEQLENEDQLEEVNEDEKDIGDCQRMRLKLGIRYDQNMIFPSDYCIPKLRGEAKGLREVLRERGLWPEKELKLKEAQELMSQQPDFLAQKGQLEEII
ncbi:45916_t:CDS:2, partial [Gigaspora margarita]